MMTTMMMMMMMMMAFISWYTLLVDGHNRHFCYMGINLKAALEVIQE